MAAESAEDSSEASWEWSISGFYKCAAREPLRSALLDSLQLAATSEYAGVAKSRCAVFILPRIHLAPPRQTFSSICPHVCVGTFFSSEHRTAQSRQSVRLSPGCRLWSLGDPECLCWKTPLRPPAKVHGRRWMLYHARCWAARRISRSLLPSLSNSTGRLVSSAGGGALLSGAVIGAGVIVASPASREKAEAARDIAAKAPKAPIDPVAKRRATLVRTQRSPGTETLTARLRDKCRRFSARFCIGGISDMPRVRAFKMAAGRAEGARRCVVHHRGVCLWRRHRLRRSGHPIGARCPRASPQVHLEPLLRCDWETEHARQCPGF